MPSRSPLPDIEISPGGRDTQLHANGGIPGWQSEDHWQAGAREGILLWSIQYGLMCFSCFSFLFQQWTLFRPVREFNGEGTLQWSGDYGRI